VTDNWLWTLALEWGIAAVLLFWGVGAYNRLVRLRSKVTSIFATLVAHFERYGQWMQTHAPLPPDPADGAAPRAGDPWTNLRAAGAQFAASLNAARGRSTDIAAMAALVAARTVLLMAWQHVDDATLAQARSGEPVPVLRAEWEAITAQTQSADKAFALAVEAYNRASRQFPAVLLAWVFGFRPARTL
jgi:LemA protein